MVEPHLGKHPGEGRVVGKVDRVVGRNVLVQLNGDGHQLLGTIDEEERDRAADLTRTQRMKTHDDVITSYVTNLVIIFGV